MRKESKRKKYIGPKENEDFFFLREEISNNMNEINEYIYIIEWHIKEKSDGVLKRKDQWRNKNWRMSGRKSRKRKEKKKNRAENKKKKKDEKERREKREDI
jgi:hypothetical protein